MASTKNLKSDIACNYILRSIEEGRFGPGHKLPTERDLANRLHLNPRTVSKGLVRMVESGLIVKQPRIGYFVREGGHPALVRQVSLVVPLHLRARGMYDDSHTDASRTIVPGEAPQTSTGYLSASAMAAGLQQVLDTSAYHLTTVYYEKQHFWRDAGQLMVNRGVRAVAFQPTPHISRDDLQKLLDHDIHLVSLQRLPPGTASSGRLPVRRTQTGGPAKLDHTACLCVARRQAPIDSSAVTQPLADLPIPQISIDLESALSQAVTHLRSLGHRRITFVRYSHGMERSRLPDLFMELVRQAGLTDEQAHILEVPNATDPGDYTVFDSLFGHGRPAPHYSKADVPPSLQQSGSTARPTALIVMDEVMVREVLRRCMRNLKRIPEDLSLVALRNNTPETFPVSISSPASLALDARSARMAGEILCKLMDGQEVEPCVMELACPIQWTESVGPPPM